MNNIQLRDSLVKQAEAALIVMATQASDLLDTADFFIERYPPMTMSDKMRIDELNIAVKDTAVLFRQLQHRVVAWKKEEEILISRQGFEMAVLIELKVTLEAMMMFFIMENIELNVFSLSVLNQAYSDLVRCNKLL